MFLEIFFAEISDKFNLESYRGGAQTIPRQPHEKANFLRRWGLEWIFGFSPIRKLSQSSIFPLYLEEKVISYRSRCHRSSKARG